MAIAWQPVVEIATGLVVGHEALARLGGESAARWLKESERDGRGREADAACRKLALESAPAEGLVFVNVLPSTLAAVIAGETVLDTAPVEPERVVWELPETVGWPATEEAVLAVRRALPDGSRLALDDFGVGAGDLGKLAAVRPAVIKVARELSHGVAGSREAQRIFRMLLDWAGEFGAVVVAEGVEREEDAALLAALGVPWGQGYLWGRPKVLVAR